MHCTYKGTRSSSGKSRMVRTITYCHPPRSPPRFGKFAVIFLSVVQGEFDSGIKSFFCHLNHFADIPMVQILVYAKDTKGYRRLKLSWHVGVDESSRKRGRTWCIHVRRNPNTLNCALGKGLGIPSAQLSSRLVRWAVIAGMWQKNED